MPQHPQQTMMLSMSPEPPRGQWQRRAMHAIGRVRNVSFPKWLTQYGVGVYIIALAVVSFLYSAYTLPWYYMLSGVIAIIVFFFYGSHLAERTSPLKIRRKKSFEQRVFLIAFLPRVIWMFLIYSINIQSYGDAFGFECGDALYYDELGQYVSELIGQGKFHFVDEISKWNGGREDISDMGYGIYLGLIYRLVGNSIIVVRLLKCLLSSLTVLLLYRLAKRNFDTQTARLSAIFCALWPNFWYYCGAHLKETEMAFLCVLFVEQADQMLRSRQFTAWKVIPVLLIGAAIFTFRMPLALVVFMSFIFSVVMSSTKVVSWGKRIIVGGLAVLLIGVTAGNRLSEEAKGLVDTVQSDQQQTNMEWRANRKDANGNTQRFAKYAGKSVFAPLIFTIPFPSMVEPFGGDNAQNVQELLNGGNFIKNIISGFTIFAMLMLLLSGRWREHLLPIAVMIGYAVVLAFSNFAQSERFHQPIMPFEMMFAAYGLSIAVTKRKYKRWFIYWCGLMFVAAIVWNWFKLAGRGLT